MLQLGPMVKSVQKHSPVDISHTFFFGSPCPLHLHGLHPSEEVAFPKERGTQSSHWLPCVLSVKKTLIHISNNNN